MPFARNWFENRMKEPFTDDCVEWPFSTSRGYGELRIDGVNIKVSHLVLGNRPEPPNNRALHSCDNPPCFNPKHLSWGSMKQNNQEKMDRGRFTPRVPTISVEDIEAMRVIYRLGHSTRDIAKMFNLGKTRVHELVR